MEQNITENGKKTNNMDKELNHGQMVPSMKVNIMKVEKMVLANLHLQMDLSMRENFNIMRSVEKASTHGVMAKNM